MLFINPEVLSGIFHWATILSIVLAALALLGKTVVLMRSFKYSKEEEQSYYDDSVTLSAESEHEVGSGDFGAGEYQLLLKNDNTKISVNGDIVEYNSGELINLQENDVIKTSKNVTLRKIKKKK